MTRPPLRKISGVAEKEIEKVKDPRSYYQWLNILRDESRALNFEKKWRDSLKTINPPERAAPPGVMQSDRWLDTLSESPDPNSDEWRNVRDWEQFRRYLQAALSVFESPLYEGRAGPTDIQRNGMKQEKTLLNDLRVAFRLLMEEGMEKEAAEVSEVGESILADVYDLRSERKALPHLNYTFRQLESMPTLSQSQADDLKIDEDGVRVWLSRMDESDGAPYHSEVTVEVLSKDTGKWEVVRQYQARPEGV